MSIATYDELKTAIADFLNREDLTSAIANFVSLAETGINRRLRHWRMQKRSVAVIDAQYATVPSDWLSSMRFYTTDAGTRPLDLISHAELLDRRSERNDRVGRPTHYAVTGGQFEFFPTPDAAYNAELVYFARVPALSDVAPTNWLLTEAADVYLYGALTHSAPFLAEDARLATWAALYQSALDSLGAASDEARYSGVGLRMKIRGMR
jgi:hypothetical protein